MDIRILVRQSASMTACTSFCASSKLDSGNFRRLFLCDSPVARIQRWVKRPDSGGKCRMDMQRIQWSRNSLRSGNKNGMRRLVSPFLNAVPPTSEDVPVIDELKVELESLQQEALQARDRYESSRARFMRLAQVAQQLQQRAVVDLKLGHEGNARQLLIEKKKVMSAAEVSKRRSHLYELLSIKLNEAISQKETQLMAALSSTPAKVTVNEDPTVRVVFPKDNSQVSFEDVLEQELDEILSSGVNGQPSLGPSEQEDGDRISSLSVGAVEDAERDSDRDVGTESQPAVMVRGVGERTERDWEVEETDSSGTVWGENYGRDPSEEDVHGGDKVQSHLWDEKESATKDLERDVLSLREESETLASKLESFFSSNKEDKIESSSRDDMEGGPGAKDTRMDISNLDEKAETKVEFNKGHEESHADQKEKILTNVDMKLLFEEYLLDIDTQIASLESKLQRFLVTADILLGNSSTETKDERVILIRNLLQQVQSLRTSVDEDD